MKKQLLLLAALLLVATGLFAQAGFSTGGMIVLVNEYGKVELLLSDSTSMLERASILVATEPDAVFDYQNDADTEEPTVLVPSPALSDFEIYGAYNNAYSGAPPDVIISQNAYGWNDGDYIIVKFNIQNNEAAYVNAMAGLDFIPYIEGEYGYDTVTYDGTNELIRFHRGGMKSMGLKLLSASLGSLYSFEWYSDYSVDTSYWNWMNFGALQSQYPSPTADGPVTITSQSAVSLNTGESFDVFYAFAVGDDEASMIANINKATQKYQQIFTSINDGNLVSGKAVLEQNRPNPFRDATVITYSLPAAGKVSLKVYDVFGSLKSVLVNEVQQQGSHSATFNAGELPAGVYYYTLQVNGQSETRKMIVTE